MDLRFLKMLRTLNIVAVINVEPLPVLQIFVPHLTAKGKYWCVYFGCWLGCQGGKELVVGLRLWREDELLFIETKQIMSLALHHDGLHGSWSVARVDQYFY